MELSNEEFEILEHTSRRATNQAYCGRADDKTLLDLVEKGFMTGPINTGFLPEGSAYFPITYAGLRAVAEQAGKDG